MVERTAVRPDVRSTRLSNRVCQTGCTTWFDNRLNELVAVRSTRLSNWLPNRFDNRFDNLLDVCIHDTAGCQTGLTTCCIV